MSICQSAIKNKFSLAVFQIRSMFVHILLLRYFPRCFTPFSTHFFYFNLMIGIQIYVQMFKCSKESAMFRWFLWETIWTKKKKLHEGDFWTFEHLRFSAHINHKLWTVYLVILSFNRIIELCSKILSLSASTSNATRPSKQALWLSLLFRFG